MVSKILKLKLLQMSFLARIRSIAAKRSDIERFDNPWATNSVVSGRIFAYAKKVHTSFAVTEADQHLCSLHT